MNYYLSTLKKYAVFTGRASITEYWYFYIFNIIIASGISLTEGLLGIFPEAEESVLSYIYMLAVLFPTIAVSVRRMHDVNKSGWFLLIPIYNFILTVTDGTKGDNKYGPDPKAIETIK